MLYPRDPKVHVERHEKTLKIEWKWGGNGGYVGLALGILTLPLFWWAAIQPNVNVDSKTLSQILAMFIPMTLFFSVPIILSALTAILNKTTIHADHDRFIVRVGPLPWMRPKLVSGKEIQQFFIGSTGSGQSTYGSLYLIDGQSHYVRLTSMFPSGFAAHQICHELQDWYGLEDLPVYGHTDLPHQPGPRAK